MENFKNEIKSMLEEIIFICEDNEIEYNDVILYDIAFEGAGSFSFHNDIECDDLPDDLVKMADDINVLFLENILKYEDRQDIMDEIIDSMI
ncbi:hypothetical protein [Flavobacterium marginilacus]|uniref:hypothetical protein n=1 Tax=Flavobacterium marginilacus TaxID=3003256 RepID=UPI00248EB6ED|nr:hypothetical protein [Flavobacterium marginilacus]